MFRNVEYFLIIIIIIIIITHTSKFEVSVCAIIAYGCVYKTSQQIVYRQLSVRILSAIRRSSISSMNFCTHASHICRQQQSESSLYIQQQRQRKMAAGGINIPRLPEYHLFVRLLLVSLFPLSMWMYTYIYYCYRSTINTIQSA